MSHEEKVYTKLKQHYHCAQAIFATYASDYGMDQETAYRTMACFAAGMYTEGVWLCYGGTCCIGADLWVFRYKR